MTKARMLPLAVVAGGVLVAVLAAPALAVDGSSNMANRPTSGPAGGWSTGGALGGSQISPSHGGASGYAISGSDAAQQSAPTPGLGLG